MADASLVDRPGDARRWLSLALLGAGTWLATVVLAAQWLETPGFAGPVQYWTSDAGDVAFLFYVRVAAMLVIFAAMIVAVAVVVSTAAEARPEEKSASRLRFALPAASVGMFAFACQQFFVNGFFPTV
jgi:hypothetical protein